MIEVEKKFQPTEEQLAKMLVGAEFVKEKKLHDIYYDYADYRLMMDKVYLRKRNKGYELKIEDKNQEGVCDEIENEEEIKKYFKTELSLEEFISNNLVVSREWKTTRTEYKKDDFIIDIDKLDFGYECVEIELLVEDSSQVDKANEQISNFAKSYGWDFKKVPAKRKEYLRIVKPKIYKELYN